MALLQQMLADSPYALYPLQETSGTTVTDRSGNGRNGSYDAAIVKGDPGPAGLLAAKVVTDGTAVKGPSGASLVAADTSDFTISMFVQLLGVGLDATNTQNMLWSQYYNSFGARSNLACGSAASGSVNISCALAGSGITSSGTPINIGQWHHVAFKRTSGTAKVLVDGVSAVSGSLPGTIDSKDSWFGGASQSGTVITLNGRMSYIGVYRTALADDRILSHARAGFRSGAVVG